MKSTKLLLLSLVIIFSSITIPSSAETGFFDDFEYCDSIENHGYTISTHGDENLTAEVRNTAAKDGISGLYMSSTPEGAVLITHYINMEIDENTTVSIDVYGVEITGYIRLNIHGGEGYLSIDYGHGQDDWEEGTSIYNSNETFAINEWYHMNRTILDDIEAGLSHPDSPYREFPLSYLESITFIQDGGGNTSYVNYFDNLFVSGEYFSYEDPTFTENTYTHTPSNDIPLFLAILYIIGGLMFLSLAVYIIGMTNIKKAFRYLFGTKSPPIIYTCELCDSPNEANALFCGNCGEKFGGSTPTGLVSENSLVQTDSIPYRFVKTILFVILGLEYLVYVLIMLFLGDYLNVFVYVIIITYILGSIFVVSKETAEEKLSLGKILLQIIAGIIVFYLILVFL